MSENHWSLNNALSPNSLPYWNCLYAGSHTSFMIEYDYFNVRAGCGSKHCVQFPYLLSSSSLGNGVKEHSQTLTLHMGQWRGASSGWPTKIYHHAMDIFLHKYSFYLSSLSFISAYSSSDLIYFWNICNYSTFGELLHSSSVWLMSWITC